MSLRTTAAVGLLVLEGGLGLLGVTFHYGLTAEYGDIGASAVDNWLAGFTTGTGGIALVVVGTAAVAVLLVASRRWIQVAAVAVPVLMVVGMLAVTPAGLREKLEVQYDASPRCLIEKDTGPGPGVRAARASQRAFDSIQHVGHFGGGGGSGVGGCDRTFVLTEDVDVLGHYRSALAAAGWRLVEDGSGRLRAHRGGLAFEVAACDRGGAVWAGAVTDRGGARCDRELNAPAPRTPRSRGSAGRLPPPRWSRGRSPRCPPAATPSP